MAPIAAYYLYANYNITASLLYLYAPPLPGDSGFRDGYNPQFPNTFSYAYNRDIVPILPPSPLYAVALGATIGGDLGIAVDACAIFDYEPVWGNNENRWYIEETLEGDYNFWQLDPLVEVDQMAVIEVILKLPVIDFFLFAEAHNHTCGHGYMNSICPELTCP